MPSRMFPIIQNWYQLDKHTLIYPHKRTDNKQVLLTVELL